jgi:hypothetical protein
LVYAHTSANGQPIPPRKSPNQLAALIAAAWGWLCLSAIFLGSDPKKTNKAVRMTSIIAITAHAK